MSLFFERAYPYLGLIAAIVLWHYFCPGFPRDVSNFLSASLTLGSILTGFVATAKAILMSLQGTQVMRDLSNSGYINDLVSYLAQSIFASFAFSVCSLVGYFVHSYEAYGYVWVGIGTLSALTFFRVMTLLLKILKHGQR